MKSRLSTALRTTIVASTFASASFSAFAATAHGAASARPTEASASQGLDAPKPMSLIDLASLQRILGPQLSPDGRTLVYALSVTDWKLGRLVYHLWKQDIAGGAPVQLTFSEGGDSPVIAWAPDGKTILFMRDGQFWLIPLDGGEPRQLTKHATSPSSPTWSPDGTAVYFIATDAASADDRERTRVRDDVYTVDETFRQRQLWKIIVSTGAETQLTKGDSSIKEYKISANGKRMVVQRAPTPADMDSFRGEVWVMDTTGENARVLTSNAIEEKSLDISPDGTKSCSPPTPTSASSSTTRPRCSWSPADGSRPPRVAAPEIAGAVDQAVWAPDGKTIFANVNLGVHTEFFRIDVASRRARQLTDGQHFIAPGWTAVPTAERIVFQVDEPSRWGEVWTLPLRGDRPAPARVTHQFDTLDRDFAIPKQEKAEWKGADGVTIEGVLFYPANYRAGERYPLVLQLHGGPMESDKFGIGPNSLLFYVPVLTGRGYFVLRPNYRGSAGYGPNFVRDVNDGYFKQMASDVTRGVDALIARGLVDPDRLALTGWSAGGTLVDKLITITDRFKVASSGAGISNWISLYGQTDNTSFRRTWFGGTPWRKDAPFDLFWENSPIKDVSRVKTPTLFFAGETDARVPKEQSVEMFRALRSLNVPTELLIAPNEGHDWRGLQHVWRKATVELEWFEKYLYGRAYTPEKPPSS